MFTKEPEEPPLTIGEKMKYFFIAYWRGILIIITPIVALLVLTPFPPQKHQWVCYVLVVIATYWMTECAPLAITSFLPIIVFPLGGVMSTAATCTCYCNDTCMMFLGSIFLALSVEQSGFHIRLAYFTVRNIGYSHYKLVFAMCLVTMFVSMWITNTAATTMMVPIINALLKVFEEQKVLVMYSKDQDGLDVAGHFTVLYFCAATYSATVGGIGTLVGTGTNLVFKGLYASDYPDEPEHLSFPKFSAFTIPLMLALEASVYVSLAIIFLGFLRPNSQAAKNAVISEEAKSIAKITILDASAKLGNVTFWEYMVVFLFGGAMVLFFCRNPEIFTGWDGLIQEYYQLPGKPVFVKDSSLACLVSFIMFLLPSSLVFFKNFTATYHEDLPKKPVVSVLCWRTSNALMPFSFMFLLGGGFAISTASKSSGLNELFGEKLGALAPLPNGAIIFMIIVVVVIVTNFASNIATCNVFTPIAMQTAIEVGQHPLWYCIASGIAASFCYMLPVGTPGNLVVQGTAKVATMQMMKAGVLPTLFAFVLIWFFIYFYAPIIWPNLYEAGPTKSDDKD